MRHGPICRLGDAAGGAALLCLLQRDTRGVALLDYVLIASMIAVVIAVVMTSFDVDLQRATASFGHMAAAFTHMVGRP